MTISGIVKSSLVDYPGIIACVLFVQGCNYNCFFCHNRSLIDGTHDLISLQYVKDFLTKRAGLLDGVVITGGEPTQQPDLVSYIEMIKGLGYRLKLDTNGSSPQIIAQLLQLELCDYYAVDYKAPSVKYQEICGRSSNAKMVLKTIDLLLHHHADFEVRTTVIPQLGEEDLVCMAKELPVVPRYVLNRYRKPEKYLPCDQLRIEQTPYAQAQMNVFADLIRTWQPNVIT